MLKSVFVVVVDVVFRFSFSVFKADADQRSRKDFMLEASIMGQFCDPNVIFLEGVVTKSESIEI